LPSGHCFLVTELVTDFDKSVKIGQILIFVIAK
jgi:hypothetical protein